MVGLTAWSASRRERVNTLPATAGGTLNRILAEPTPRDLWDLQKDLLALGSETAEKARIVAKAFHACLRNLDSKTASRSASRWGAVLGTAAVSSVGLDDILDRQEDRLRHLMSSGASALLEVGSAVKTAQAWEVEARLMYDEMAWFLYEELWDISLQAAPKLTPDDRRAQIDQLLDPLLDSEVDEKVKAPLVVQLFCAALAARVWPLLRR
jgi:hypothetical protein